MNFFIVSSAHCILTLRMATTWSAGKVLMTTVTQQSMMLDWLDVGSDSDHSTVKVNVNVTVDNRPAFTATIHYREIIYIYSSLYDQNIRII